MISIENLPDNTKRLFSALSSAANNGELDDMLLIGGTALAMHLGHRMSEDLDFAIGTLRLPVTKISEVMKKLESTGCQIVDILNVADRENFENDGLDIENYQQDWLVNGVKLTFFTFGNNEYEQSIIGSSKYEVFEGIKIASLETIALTKCHALTKRTKSRDLFDIYHLIQDDHLSIEAVVAGMQKFNPHLTYENCLHRIVEKPVQKDDEGLHPVGVEIPIEQIRGFLLEKFDELEKGAELELGHQFNCAEILKTATIEAQKQYPDDIRKQNAARDVLAESMGLSKQEIATLTISKSKRSGLER